MSRLFGLFSIAIDLAFRVLRRLWMYATRGKFKACGHGVVFNPFDSFSFATISLGNDVFIAEGAIFQASESGITIGDKVMFGPRVMIMGGDHNTQEIGRYMFDVKVKQPCNDLPVIVEDDVWVGCGAIILKGVTIGRGAIVGAGSVVTSSVSPYSIVAGNPARILKNRFEPEQIAEHERLLGNGN